MSETGLFADLPVQRPPAFVELDGRRLIACEFCDGTGEGDSRWWPESDWEPCPTCNGGKVLLLRVDLSDAGGGRG